MSISPVSIPGRGASRRDIERPSYPLPVSISRDCQRISVGSVLQYAESRLAIADLAKRYGLSQAFIKG
jgi:hypothetical protein